MRSWPIFSVFALVSALVSAAGCAATTSTQAPSGWTRYDVIIRRGLVYDGTGAPGVQADVGLRGDRIAGVGDLTNASATVTVDANGLAVAPGFINMLSWSTESLIVDGRSLGEIRQGVTTEIFGEGTSMGPLTGEMKKRWKSEQGDIKFEYEWTTLAEYLKFLERKGVAPNVASFIGAGTIRENVIGLANRAPTPAELDRMRALVRQEMEAGALGIGTSLIYAPDSFASTEELIELCKVAASYGGKYISHMRSEGNRLVEAVQELLRISREAKIPAEIFHLKAAGQSNWGKMDRVLEMVEDARASGQKITADMYLYPAGSTGLNAAIPPSALDGGYQALFKRLRDPAERARIKTAMSTPTDEWENLHLAAGSPERVLLVDFKNEKLKPLTGKTLAEVAKLRGKDPFDTILDLMLEDESRVGAVYFLMSEDNIKKQLQRPWVSLGSDASSMAPEGVFLKSSTHPRAYGNFARLFAKYVREDRVLSIEEAIRRVTSLPATNLELVDRGRLQPGMFADVVVFNPATIQDHATFEKPHQLADGVQHVFVNGVQVLKDGAPTGKLGGRALRGRGAR
ncbi:MAG TPA: D-aminoacylase [Vicinamibacterales bacterium]|nr:D-aminoacylase [Vicinamibacterales bacterium]